MENIPVKTASTIEGLFRGFSPQSLFKLADGTYWLQTCDTFHLAHSMNPEAGILETSDGLFLKVEGMDNMVKVVQVADVIESRIKGRFTGWNGKSVYTLTNGQIWQQAKFKTKYVAKYMPEVLIYNSPYGDIMQVAGTSAKVRRIG